MISCIIVNHNCSYLVRLCVDALLKAKKNSELEIIIVDNASGDESVAYLHALEREGKITLVRLHKNYGYGTGNNRGVAHAKGEFVLILNPDVVVEENTVSALHDFLQEHHDVGMVAPRLFFYNGETQDSCRRFMSPFDLIIKRTFLRRLPLFEKRLRHYVMTDVDHAKTRDVDIVTGACFMMRRDFFNELGGFDERYFLFMEDVDLCRRVWLAGKRVVYFPKIGALHYHKRLSSGSMWTLFLRKIFWIHVKSASQYFWKWRGKPLPGKTGVF